MNGKKITDYQSQLFGLALSIVTGMQWHIDSEYHNSEHRDYLTAIHSTSTLAPAASSETPKAERTG